MKITDQAKEYIQQAMKDKQVFTLRIYGIHGCCGVNLGIALQEPEENDLLEQVNGVNIAIQVDMKDQISNVTIDEEEENGEMGITTHLVANDFTLTINKKKRMSEYKAMVQHIYGTELC